jgi:hypothetical protein
MRVVLGGGIVGLGPTPACSGNFAASPQAPRSTEIDPMINRFVVIFTGALVKSTQALPRLERHKGDIGSARRCRVGSPSHLRKVEDPETGLALIRPAAQAKDRGSGPDACAQEISADSGHGAPGEHGARQLNFHTASGTMRSRPRPLPTAPPRLPCP